MQYMTIRLGATVYSRMRTLVTSMCGQHWVQILVVIAHSCKKVIATGLLRFVSLLDSVSLQNLGSHSC